MTTAGVLDVLARNDLFGALSPAERDTLAQSCQLRSYEPAQRIFTRGETGSTMYLIAQGAVALSVSSAGGDEVVLAVLRPPQSFGELSLIDQGVRIATATAHRRTVLICVPHAIVTRLLRGDAAFAQAMLVALAQLIRRVDDHVADLVLLDLRARVIKYLIGAARANHRARDAARSGALAVVDIELNQTDLARLVGGSRQHVNRIIVALERQGAIRRTGSRIVAVRLDLLTN